MEEIAQMFTDFVHECATGKANGIVSAMIADEMKVGGSDAKLVAAVSARD